MDNQTLSQQSASKNDPPNLVAILKDLIQKTQRKGKKEQLMQLMEKHDVSPPDPLTNFLYQRKQISD